MSRPSLDELKPVFSEINALTQSGDMPRRIELCRYAIEFVDQNENPRLWATLFSELGSSLRQNPVGDCAQNIEEAIQCFAVALEAMTSETMPMEWAGTLNNLGIAYAGRIRGDRAENIEKAVRCYKRALVVRTRDARRGEWAETMMNLGIAYTDRIRGDREENIEEAIRCHEQALEVICRDAQPVGWAQLMNNLANAYHSRIRGNRWENIEKAIQYHKLALEIRSCDAMPMEWTRSMNNLAVAYAARIRGNRAENIEKAIRCHERALEVLIRLSMPVEWARSMVNLAAAYSGRIRGDRGDNIETAIRCYKQALDVITRDTWPVEWATIMMNLANALSDRIRGDRAQNLEKAINGYKQALEIRTRDAMPVEWAEALANLGAAYYGRIRGSRPENIEEAIHCFEQAQEVNTREAMSLEWAGVTMSLGAAYHSRVQGSRAENIEIAIRCFEQVLDVRIRDAMPLEWAEAAMNLASAYSMRVRGDRNDNIEKAIHYYEQVMEMMTRDVMPVEWAEATVNLANACIERVQGDRADNIDKAIQCYEDALNVMTRDAMPLEWAQIMNNLGNAWSRRIRGNRVANIGRAIRCWRHALEVMTLDAMPSDHRRTQRNIGELCLNERLWKEAAEAFAGMLTANEILYKTAALPKSRQTELCEVRGVSACMAYAMAKTAGPETSGDLEKAVEALERNRARWLSESLSLKSGKPNTLPDTVWHEFERYRTEYSQLLAESRLSKNLRNRRAYTKLAAAMRSVMELLDGILAEVRNYEPEFMINPDFEQIRAGLSPGESLVYVAVTPMGSVAFLVPCKGESMTLVWLDNLTEDTLSEKLGGLKQDEFHQMESCVENERLNAEKRILSGYIGAYLRWRGNPQHSEFRKTWFEVLDGTTNWLWESLMKPVTKKLVESGISRGILIPYDLLGLLPLHAAWTVENGKRRYALDYVCYTYMPNALSLASCRNIARQIHPERLLAVEEPSTGNAFPLRYSNEEVAAICGYFDRKTIRADEMAGRKAVREALPGHDVFHFLCHGMTDFAEPLDSGLRMANGKTLTLRDFLSTEGIHARLAVLSACETGIPDLKNADEAIGLPAGLIQAGVAGVAASLWPVSDLSTMVLMIRFYEFWRKGDLDPPEALRRAQIWMRDTSNGQKAGYFAGYLPEFGKPDKQDLPVQLADMLYKRFLFRNPDENDFEHPFYWAAFGYTGV